MAADDDAPAQETPATATSGAEMQRSDAGEDTLATDAELREIKEHSRRKTLGIRAASATVLLGFAVAIYYFLGDRGLDLLVGAVAALCFLELIFLIIKITDNVPYRLAAILAGACYIGLGAVILIAFDIQYFYMTIAVVVLADTFAYVFGTLIGGPRILPRVSPNKTWAGLLGGMFGGFLALTPLIYLSSRIMGVLDMQALIVAAIAGPVLAAVALAGDLFESWLKRKAGVKDSSRLIPGHGGFFDRFDGVIPVAIVIGVITSLA
ncbi:phosphatidate cytidylyltransferase [Citromicrobium bathyomarinum]|uniref:phosphatidate cytidylyltransferase n=1 Tax=Citromicrobium bathyomarinum TaxID=72174 RepID=UPI00315A624B